MNKFKQFAMCRCSWFFVFLLFLGLSVSVHADVRTVTPLQNGEQTALTNLVAGDEIIIADGEYNSVDINISGSGEESRPILIRAETPGGVIITGTPKIVVSGEYITLSDLYFSNSNTNSYIISFNEAENCRLTGCYFFKTGSASNPGYRIIDLDKANYNRIDHNTFEQNTAIGIAVRAPSSIPAEHYSTHNKIDHNYFKDIARASDLFPSYPNGMECLQIGTSTMGAELFTEVSYNLFENVIGDGNEIISNKSSKNVYQYNTFLNNQNSGVSIRTGNDTIWNRNYFINCLSGITIYGEGHRITNNYFHNITRSALVLPTANYNTVPLNYKQSDNNLIANNTIINPFGNGIVFGAAYDASASYAYPPKNTRIYNNIIMTDKLDAILDYSSLNTDYKNNIINITGAGLPGVENQGIFKVGIPANISLNTLGGSVRAAAVGKEMSFSKSGGIWIPADLNVRDRGIYLQEAYECDEMMQSLTDTRFDIGINNANTPLSAQGFLNVNDVGPENKWWVNLLRGTPGEAFINEPAESPEKYSPANRSMAYITDGAFHLGALAGTAQYENQSFKVPSRAVSYKVTKGGDLFEINGEYITAKDIGTGTFSAEYKGKSVSGTIKALPVATSFQKNFDNEGDISDMYLYGTWKIENGVLKNENTNRSRNYIVEQSMYLKGDYKLSANITLKDNGSTGVYATDGYIIFGYRDNPKTQYYCINLGGVDFYQSGVYLTDEYYARQKVAELSKRFETDVPYLVEIRKKGDVITFSVDGEIIGVYESNQPLDGRIGFGSHHNEIEIDSVTVTAPESSQESEVALSLQIAQTDLYEAELQIENPKSGDFIYKIYRDGIWLTDTKELTYLDAALEGKFSFEYKVVAYDAYGNLAAQGVEVFQLPKTPPNNLFYISNIRYRMGLNGAEVGGIYHGYNKGLDSTSWVFDDLSYTYSTIDEQFLGCGYIRQPSAFVNNAIATNPSTSDWLKFDLNNRSATVYVIFHNLNQGSVVPNWIDSDNWESTDYVIKHNNDTVTSSHVFKKSFQVDSGESVTVTMGGYGCKPTRPYSIIIMIAN